MKKSKGINATTEKFRTKIAKHGTNNHKNTK